MDQTERARSMRPVVFEHISLPDILEHVLFQHAAPSTLVVCGTRQTFLEQLQASLSPKAPESDQCAPESTTNAGEPLEDRRPHVRSTLLAAPTLRFLSANRTLKLVCCPDVTHLRAYLATYCASDHDDTGRGLQSQIESLRNGLVPMLALLNPIALHKPTSAYSAQGLNRTLSTAVEAAHRAQARLVVAECSTDHPKDQDENDLTRDEDADAIARPGQSVWDDEVSILNVTTKSFGAGERGWAGRTVKLRTIAERWCTFESFSTIEAENEEDG